MDTVQAIEMLCDVVTDLVGICRCQAQIIEQHRAADIEETYEKLKRAESAIKDCREL